MATYASTFGDFDELAIQYGFSTFFVTAFPLTPLLALLNNCCEMLLDAFKLLRNTRRPEPKGAQTIGTWYYIMNIQGYMAVIVNTFLLVFYVNENVGLAYSQGATPTQRFSIFILIEHCMILLKFTIEFFVPDQTEETTLKLARQSYVKDSLVMDLAVDDDDEDALFDLIKSAEHTETDQNDVRVEEEEMQQDKKRALFDLDTIDLKISDAALAHCDS